MNDPVDLRVTTPYPGLPHTDDDGGVSPALFAPSVQWTDAELRLPPGLLERCRQIYLSASASGAKPLGVTGVTSTWRREGRTSIALGMAAAMAADTTEPTLLVECDIEQVALGRIFGAPSNGGLTDWLHGTAPLQLTQAASLDNVVVLCAGSSFVNAARAMHRLVQSGLVEELRSRFRNVVLDLPPMQGVAYGALAARLAERILLVVRQGVTPIEDVERSIGLVGREQLAGLVLNAEVVKTPRWIRRLL